MNQPGPVFNILVHHVELSPSLSGLDIGYESGNWRNDQLAEFVMDWLPEFALPLQECEKIGHYNAVSFIRRAARIVYETEKFSKRGEFGELFLHIAMRQIFNSLPAISKIYYKSANNDTVKGFDAVHVVPMQDGLELWIGEAKFYSDINAAIHDVVNELTIHTQIDYLRTEFTLITNKIDEKFPHYEVLKNLMDPRTSLDEIFKRACIPVLLTYNSEVINKYNRNDGDYIEDFRKEILSNYKKFSESKLPENIHIHLFLFPIKEKERLIEALDARLKKWQQI